MIDDFDVKTTDFQYFFIGEQRKIEAAEKYFQALGIDYRVVDDKVVDWWG